MRRILIMQDIVEKATYYRDHLFEGRDGRFKMPSHLLVQLSAKVQSDPHLSVEQKVYFDQYIDRILNRYDEILTLRIQDLNDFLTRNPQLKPKVVYNQTTRKYDCWLDIKIDNVPFHKHIVKAMRYDAVRDKEFIPVIRDLGIKTCVYCNAQFAITIDEKNGESKGYYELDHILPKSKLPFLCTTFFNLAPSCSCCNKRKLDADVKYNLYTDDPTKLMPFSFRLEPSSMIRYLVGFKADELEIKLDSKDQNLLKSHECFHVDDIYREHLDVVESLIWKNQAYNSSFRKVFRKNYKGTKLKLTNEQLKRFFYGFYTNEEDVNKQPLTKMQQDVAHQIGLLK